MNFNILIISLVAIVSVSTGNVCRAQHDLPAEIQSIVNSQLFLGSGPIGEFVPGFTDDIGTYFEYLDFQNGAQRNYVLCYRLGASSSYNSTSPAETVPFSGNLFVYCKGEFPIDSLADSPQFFVYLQDVEPNITSVNFLFESETIDLRFKDLESFFDGFGQYCIQDIYDGLTCEYSPCDSNLNNLDTQAMPIFPLAGCGGAAGDFHLPGLRYVDNSEGQAELEFVNEFDFSDPNFRLVFRQQSYWLEGGFLATQTFEIPLFAKGDTNMDGQINLLDVAGFVNCLTSGQFQFQCDLDSSLSVDLLDVQPFVELLASGF